MSGFWLFLERHKSVEAIENPIALYTSFQLKGKNTMPTLHTLKRLFLFSCAIFIFSGTLMLTIEVNNSFALVLSEGFEQDPTIFEYTSANNTPFIVQSTGIVRTGSFSFNVGSTDCHNHCYEPSHSVFAQHIFSNPAFVDSVVFWVREGSSSGFGWGAWLWIGHDGVWDGSFDAVENGAPVTDEWVRVVTPIDTWVTSVDILVEDMTDLSSIWIDDLDIFINETVTAVGRTPYPEAVSLRQNFPNPFNPSTSIVFTVLQNTQLSIQVMDVSGKTVKTLATNRSFGIGSHTIQWNGKNNSEREMASGVYFYRVRGTNINKMGKMVLLR